MKRFIAISLLVLSNILLLAHAVIPHHHHDGLVTALVEQQCEHHQHTTKEDHHEDSSDDCILKVVLSRITTNNGSESIDNTFYNHLCTFYCFSFDLLDPIINSKSIRHNPYPTPFYSHWQINTAGLRAPPFC